jgi:hypothetical protein
MVARSYPAAKKTSAAGRNQKNTISRAQPQHLNRLSVNCGGQGGVAPGVPPKLIRARAPPVSG